MDSDHWVSGPDLPLEIYLGVSVQLKDTFLIVAGFGYNVCCGSDWLSTIFQFDIETEAWVELPLNLTYPGTHREAFLVPDELCVPV